MPVMNLEPLSGAELRALAKAAERELAKRQQADLKRVAGQIRALAAQQGLTLAEVLRHGKGGKGPAQYQHPDDGALTWTGRGKRPRWINDWLAQGKALAALHIKAAAAPAPSAHEHEPVSGATGTPDDSTPRAAPARRQLKRQGASGQKTRRPASEARRAAQAKGV